jgi:hypothetical protein
VNRILEVDGILYVGGSILILGRILDVDGILRASSSIVTNKRILISGEV